MTTVAELKDVIGAKAAIRIGTFGENGLVVQVTVKDVKFSYGRERYLVTPVAGAGEVWVERIFL